MSALTLMKRSFSAKPYRLPPTTTGVARFIFSLASFHLRTALPAEPLPAMAIIPSECDAATTLLPTATGVTTLRKARVGTDSLQSSLPFVGSMPSRRSVASVTNCFLPPSFVRIGLA